jgi:hypothetical protein
LNTLRYIDANPKAAGRGRDFFMILAITGFMTDSAMMGLLNGIRRFWLWVRLWMSVRRLIASFARNIPQNPNLSQKIIGEVACLWG